MNFENAELPWSGAPVRKLARVQDFVGGQLPAGWARYLPESITLFFDSDVAEPAVQSFLVSMAAFLKAELKTRMERKGQFVQLGLLSEAELECFLTTRTAVQPWAIYFSSHGGLGIADGVDEGFDPLRRCGVVPCSSMRNHGVAWEQIPGVGTRVWLATARKINQDWDWNSDIGHESAHSAFAHVPLFVQAVHQSAESLRLTAVDSLRNLTPGHLVRISYFYSELAVVGIRGEPRPTTSGLPVADPDELLATLQLSEELFPDAGFQRALAACEQAHGFVDVNEGDAIFEIAAPILRVLPRFTPYVCASTVPTLDALRKMAPSTQN